MFFRLTWVVFFFRSLTCVYVDDAPTEIYKLPFVTPIQTNALSQFCKRLSPSTCQPRRSHEKRNGIIQRSTFPPLPFKMENLFIYLIVGKESGINTPSDRTCTEVEYQETNRDISHARIVGDWTDGGYCGRRGS